MTYKPITNGDADANMMTNAVDSRGRAGCATCYAGEAEGHAILRRQSLRIIYRPVLRQVARRGLQVSSPRRERNPMNLGQEAGARGHVPRHQRGRDHLKVANGYAVPACLLPRATSG